MSRLGGIYCRVWTSNGYQDLTFDQWSYFIHANYKNLYRLDGPSVVYHDGTKGYYQNGILHRTDGPAIEYSNGETVWMIHNKELNAQEVETWLEENQIDLSTCEGQTAFVLRWT